MIRLCVARPKGKKDKKLTVESKRFKDVTISENQVSDSRKEIKVEVEELFLRPPPYVPRLSPMPQGVAAAVAAGGVQPETAAVSGGLQPGARQKKKGRPLAPKDERDLDEMDLPVVDGEEVIETQRIGDEAGMVEASGVVTRSASRAEAARRDFVAPLRQIGQAVMDQQGAVQIQSIFQYVPFTTTDLLNWKQHYGPMSVKPAEVADLVQTIMQTHNPTWQDVHQLLSTLLTPEEREKWKAAVRQCLKDRFPAVQDIQSELNARAPDKDPEWDVRDPEKLKLLKEYQNLVVEALRKAGKPPVNMSKPSLVMQEADESPEGFLQRLIEAYELYTQVDPRSADNVRMLNERFIAQSYEDIRRKLQRLEGALGKNTTELLEVARKVFVNRDRTEKKEKEAWIQKNTELLAVALQGGTLLGPNQCANCREEGHWQRECPKQVMRGRGWRGRMGRGRVGVGGGQIRSPFRGRRQRGFLGDRRDWNRDRDVDGIGLAGTGWTD